jgi:hypothetical protein
MGHPAKKLTLIIYTMQTCVLENMGFQNMDYPIQTEASPQNTIWTAYNQGGMWVRWSVQQDSELQGNTVRKLGGLATEKQPGEDAAEDVNTLHQSPPFHG